MKPGRNCWNINNVNKTGIIFDGHDYYSAFYQAARLARKTILISGWQFDSDVKLLRAGNGDGDISFLDFLKSLCVKNPELRIYILAWDYSFLYSLGRERKQKLTFSNAHRNIFFHFDRQHAFAASQHQKFVVIDSAMSFIGGMDICAGRWDDRRHAAHNPLRVNGRGKEYQPYHDVQSYHTGPLAERLAELFCKSWKKSTGRGLAPSRPAPALACLKRGREALWPLPEGVSIPARRAAISRTQARSLVRWKKSRKEIRRLYTDAVASAQTLIYIENQYFSSFSVYRALARRMKSAPSKLQIIIVIPKMDQTLLEKIYAGIAQKRILNSLKRIARRRGHQIGVYYPAAPSSDGKDVPVFIHSKLMLIDDRFLTVGSANTNNRSMGLDTELNVSWEADDKQDGTIMRALNKVRTGLLSEHTGLSSPYEIQMLSRTAGLVDFLESIADKPQGRLRRHKKHRPFFISDWLRALKLDRILIDPEKAVIDENILDAASTNRKSVLRRIINFVKIWRRPEGSLKKRPSKKE